MTLYFPNKEGLLWDILGSQVSQSFYKIVTAWLNAVNEITKSDIPATFIDFSRAFETVDYCWLLITITDYSTAHSLWHTLNRGHCWSQPQPVLSGVPQGGLLAPLSFVLCFITLDDRLPRAVCLVKYSMLTT